MNTDVCSFRSKSLLSVLNSYLYQAFNCKSCLCVMQVTVMHSMQAGYLEKAQKYTDKALMQLEKLKSESALTSIQMHCSVSITITPGRWVILH